MWTNRYIMSPDNNDILERFTINNAKRCATDLINNLFIQNDTVKYPMYGPRSAYVFFAPNGKRLKATVRTASRNKMVGRGKEYYLSMISS